MGEIRPYIGGFGRVALSFEYSGETTGLKGLEVGAMVDVYQKTVPIMAELEGVRNKQIFFEFYLALQFGKKFV